MPKKIIFMGTPLFAVPILKSLYQNGFPVSVVYTQPPQKSNRGHKINKSPIQNIAETLNIDLSKQQQSSNWGAEELSEDQKKYAASDVIYLHKIKSKLDEQLVKMNRQDMANECFSFIKTRVDLDLKGWPDIDIFSH